MKLITLLLGLYSFITNKINIKCVYEELTKIEYIYDDYKVLEREEDIEILYTDDFESYVQDAKAVEKTVDGTTTGALDLSKI